MDAQEYFEQKGRPELRKGTIVKHFKRELNTPEDEPNKYLYKIIDIATDCSNNDKKVVIYQAMYGNCELYTRELDEFCSEVDKEKYPNIKQKYRLEFVQYIYY